jgi:hypothetical protein
MYSAEVAYFPVPCHFARSTALSSMLIYCGYKSIITKLIALQISHSMGCEVVLTCISLSYKCSNVVFPAFLGHEIKGHVCKVEGILVCVALRSQVKTGKL